MCGPFLSSPPSPKKQTQPHNSRIISQFFFLSHLSAKKSSIFSLKEVEVGKVQMCDGHAAHLATPRRTTTTAAAAATAVLISPRTTPWSRAIVALTHVDTSAQPFTAVHPPSGSFH